MLAYRGSSLECWKWGWQPWQVVVLVQVVLSVVTMLAEERSSRNWAERKDQVARFHLKSSIISLSSSPHSSPLLLCSHPGLLAMDSLQSLLSILCCGHRPGPHDSVSSPGPRPALFPPSAHFPRHLLQDSERAPLLNPDDLPEYAFPFFTYIPHPS